MTGTLWSGDVGRGDELAVLPGGRRARVRGVQVHDERVERADAGQRVAVNLVNVAPRRGRARRRARAAARAASRPTGSTPRCTSVRRGGPRTATACTSTTARARAPARLAELGGRFWQLRLEQPLVPRAATAS